MNIQGALAKAIRSSSEPKELKRFTQQHLWENVQTGLEFCCELGKAGMLPLTDRQKTILYRIADRVQGATARLSPQKLLEIAEAYASFSLAQDTYFASVILHAGNGEVSKSTRIISNYAKAQLSNIELPSTPEMFERFQRMELMFGCLTAKSPQGHWYSATWPNFLQGVARGQPEAIKALENLIILYALDGATVVFVPFSKWSKIWSTQLPKSLSKLAMADFDKGFAKFPVPDEILDDVNRICEGIYGKYREHNRRFLSFLDWWERNSRQFAKERQNMWQDIVLRPRYGLRSGGQDKIDIAIEAFQDSTLGIGHDFLQLFPEEEYPNARAKFWWRVGGNPVSITLALEPTDALLRKPLLTLNRFDRGKRRRRRVDEIRYHVALYAYWRIATGENEADATSADASKRKRRARTRTIVRPFFRTLPVSQKASDEAKERSRKTLGILPPPTKTFVREHERGWQEAESLEPLFAITDQDIGYSH